MSAIADKVMNSCCGDKLDTVCSKLPFKKPNNNIDGSSNDVDVTPAAEEKKEDHVSTPAPMKKPTKSGVVTAFDMKYELTKWKDLPAKVRKAGQDVLGYDEKKWNDSEWVEVDSKHWWDLEAKELEAVKLFGWDEDTWEHKYEHSAWSELPEVAKRAAEAAGYTEKIWDESEHPVEEKYWSEMTDKEIVALSVLGWTQAKWDD